MPGPDRTRYYLAFRQAIPLWKVDCLRVTHPSAAKHILYCYSCHFARLACVKHAASVHSEPGSNSPDKSYSLGLRDRFLRSVLQLALLTFKFNVGCFDTLEVSKHDYVHGSVILANDGPSHGYCSIVIHTPNHPIDELSPRRTAMRTSSRKPCPSCVTARAYPATRALTRLRDYLVSMSKNRKKFPSQSIAYLCAGSSTR